MNSLSPAAVLLALLFAGKMVSAAPADVHATASVTALSERKIFDYGWAAPDTQYIRDHWREMEKSPLDGTGVAVAIDRSKPVVGDGATDNLLNWKLFSPRAFAMKDFRAAIDDLKAAKWQRPMDNFLVAILCSKGQDQNFNWFDDARWKTILNNWRIFATIAKEGGCKGIFIDPEHYNADFFHYPTMNGRVAKSYADYVAQVRKRGRQLMQVSEEIFPGATYPMMWAHSYMALHPTERLKPHSENAYGLLGAFTDGMLEASGDKTRFHDLCEFAYGYTDQMQFLESYHGITNRSAALSAVPDKYRQKMRAGFGLWIDNTGKWDATDFSKNYFTPEAFEKSLRLALQTSDRYVWIYHHQAQFNPGTGLPSAYWKAIEAARQPAAP